VAYFVVSINQVEAFVNVKHIFIGYCLFREIGCKVTN
jgi:hypothetical protein